MAARTRVTQRSCRVTGSVFFQTIDTHGRPVGASRNHDLLTVSFLPAERAAMIRGILDDGPLPGMAARLLGARAGDLYVQVHVRPDPRFVREGNDVYCTVDLTLPQAALGATVNVSLGNGSRATPSTKKACGTTAATSTTGRPMIASCGT